MVIVLVGEGMMIGAIRFSKGFMTPSQKDKPVLRIEEKDDPRTCALRGNTHADSINGCVLPLLQNFKTKEDENKIRLYFPAISKSSHVRSVGWMERNVKSSSLMRREG